MAPKNIVISCDGTGNKLDVPKTNIVRFLSLARRDDPERQVAPLEPERRRDSSVPVKMYGKCGLLAVTRTSVAVWRRSGAACNKQPLEWMVREATS